MKPCLPPVRGGRVRWCHVMTFPMVRSLPSPLPAAHFPKISRKYIWELSRALTDFTGNGEAKCLCLSESPTHLDHIAHFFRRTRNLQCGDTFPCWWPSLQQLSGRKMNLSKPIVGLVPGAGQTPHTAHSHPSRMWWQGSSSSRAHQLPLLCFISGLTTPGGGSQSQLQFWDVLLVF